MKSFSTEKFSRPMAPVSPICQYRALQNSLSNIQIIIDATNIITKNMYFVTPGKLSSKLSTLQKQMILALQAKLLPADWTKSN